MKSNLSTHTQYKPVTGLNERKKRELISTHHQFLSIKVLSLKAAGHHTIHSVVIEG